MKTKKLNVFILAENALVVNGLRHYLEDRFGPGVHISSFYDSKSCLRQANTSTDAIVVDYFIEGKKGSDVIRAVKTKNPVAQGIFHSNNQDVAASIEVLLKGVSKPNAGSASYAYKFDDQYSHYYARR